jgi:hypothetical protein
MLLHCLLLLLWLLGQNVAAHDPFRRWGAF